MSACYLGHKDVVQLLMDHSGIDLNVRDNTGRTALMIASQRGDNDIVHLLKSKSSSLCHTLDFIFNRKFTYHSKTNSCTIFAVK